MLPSPPSLIRYPRYGFRSQLANQESFIDGLPGGKKVILNGPIFFGFPSNNQPVQFLSDHQSRWSALTGSGGLTAAQYQRVSAIFLVDEPELSSAVTDAQFATARSMVQSVRPSGSGHTPALATIYSYLVTGNQPSKSPVGIAFVDWLGFDCYPVSYGGSWANCGGTSMTHHLANLKSKRTSPGTQKIMLVAETRITRTYAGDPIDSGRRNQAIANLKLMRDIMLSDSEVNGIVAFKFEGVNTPDGLGPVGLQELGDVFSAAKALGKCTIGAATCAY